MAKGSLANKQNRLDRLVGLLRQDEAWTLKHLSENLDASERTLLRDIKELRDQGYPIETERGRGGGISLRHRWGVDKLRLNYEEVINLLVSLAITETLQSPLLTQQVKTVRQKITHGFPEQQRKMINQLRKRILVGEMAASHIYDTYTPPRNHILKTVTACFFNMETMEIKYTAGTGNVTQRKIEPQYLFLNYPVWYLLGWDHLRQAPRVFRIDRVNQATTTKQRFNMRRKDLLMGGIEEFYRLL